MLSYREHYSSRDQIDLTVTVDSSSVKVSGSCTIAGADYTVTPTAYTLVDSPDVAQVEAMLTFDPNSPATPGVVFTADQTPVPGRYYNLLRFVVPAHITDPSGLDITVHRTKPPVPSETP